jgi:hypothetical protein
MPDYDVNISIEGLPGVKKKIAKIQSSPNSMSLMSEIGLFILTRIKVRTSQGVDYEGKVFRPYSPGYKLFRQKTGHPTSKVNLTYTGSMLSSMSYDPAIKAVKVYFLNTNDRSGTSNPLKAYFLNQDRKFFALSRGDVVEIVRLINEYYRRLL